MANPVNLPAMTAWCSGYDAFLLDQGTYPNMIQAHSWHHAILDGVVEFRCLVHNSQADEGQVDCYVGGGGCDIRPGRWVEVV
jgi:hypothetical protein